LRVAHFRFALRLILKMVRGNALVDVRVSFDTRIIRIDFQDQQRVEEYREKKWTIEGTVVSKRLPESVTGITVVDGSLMLNFTEPEDADGWAAQAVGWEKSTDTTTKLSLYWELNYPSKRSSSVARSNSTSARTAATTTRSRSRGTVVVSAILKPFGTA
jgi:hypothetical protein